MLIDPTGRLYSPKTRKRRGAGGGFNFSDPSKYSYNASIEMVRRNSLVGSMVDLIAMWVRKVAFKYQNEDREIYEFIAGTPVGQESQYFQHGQLQDNNSVAAITSMLSSYPIFGNVYAEFSPLFGREEWGFGVLNPMEPGEYKYVRRKEDSADGFKGQILGVNVDQSMVPIEKSIYLRHGGSISFGDPYGYPIYERLEPLVQSWTFVLEEYLTVIGQQGGKKLIATAEDGESPLLGPDGRPLIDANTGQPIMVSNVWLLAEQLGTASKNNDSIVTSNKNSVNAIDTESDGQIFDNCINLLRALILMAMLGPESIFFSSGSGLGGSGFAEQHAKTLMDFLESMAQSIAEEIQRVIIDHLVVWNFGPERNRGALVPPKSKDPDRVELLKLLTGFTAEALTADPLVIESMVDKVKELL